MNPAGRLGELYNLSPATVSGLADITGGKFVNPMSPEALHAAEAEANGVPATAPGAAFGPPPPPKHYALDERGYAITENTTPEQIARRTGVAPGGPDTTPQGPGRDTFPTVREVAATNPEVAGQVAAAGPTSVVPAHWQPGSHSVGLQHGMAPGELAPGMAARDVAMGHDIIAADKHLQAAQQRGEADAIYAAAHQEASRQATARIGQLNAERDAYVVREHKKLDQLAAAAQKEVNPDQFAGRDGARIAAALMMALNQFAVMWRGRGTNTAMQIINQSNDDFIKAQQANISNANRAFENRQGIYARNLAAFGDQERAILATKMQYLDGVAAQADGMRAKAGNAENEAGYQKLMGSIYNERAGYADQFAKLTHTQATEQMNEAFHPAAVVGGGVAGQKGKSELYVPTLGGYARDEKAATLLNQKGSLRMQITENMRQVNGLMNDAKGLSSASPSGYMRLKQIDEQIQSLVNDTLTKNTVLEGQGAMSAGDKEVAAVAKGLSGASVQWKPNAFIEKRQENIRKAATNVLTQHRLEGEAYGIQQGTEQYVQGASGPEPVRKLEGRNARPSKNTQAVDDLVEPPRGVAQPRE